MQDEFRAFINVYKLLRRSSLKYGPLKFSINSSSQEYVFNLIDGEIVIEKYKDGQKIDMVNSISSGIASIGPLLKQNSTKKLIKSLFIESINEKFRDNNADLEFNVSEIADYSLIKGKVVSFDFDYNGKKVPYLISHVDTEAIYRINQNEVSFDSFVDSLAKNNIEFKLMKRQLIKSLNSKVANNEASIKQRDYSKLGLNTKAVDGKIEVDFESFIDQRATKEPQDKKKVPQKIEKGKITDSKLLDKILFGDKKDNNKMSGTTLNKKG